MLSRVLQKRARVQPGVSIMDENVFFAGGRKAAAGVTVSEDAALSSDAVLAAITKLSSAIGMVPLQLQRWVNKGWEDAEGEPLYNALMYKPCKGMTPFTLKQQIVGSLLLRGNAIVWKHFNGRGQVVDLVPLSTKRTTIVYNNDNIQGYLFITALGQQIALTPDEVIHIKGWHVDGVLGLSLVNLGCEAIGSAIAAEQTAAAYFSNGVSPAGALEYPGKFKTDEERQRILRNWVKAHSGPANKQKLALLEEGIKYTAFSPTPEETQLLESRQYSVRQVARVFGIPPHMLCDLVQSTWNNVLFQGIEYVTHSLGPIVTNIVEELFIGCVLERQWPYMRILPDYNVFLRGDPEALSRQLKNEVQGGIRTPNEARIQLGLRPVEGGDNLYIQGAMRTLQSVAVDSTKTSNTGQKENGNA